MIWYLQSLIANLQMLDFSFLGNETSAVYDSNQQPRLRPRREKRKRWDYQKPFASCRRLFRRRVKRTTGAGVVAWRTKSWAFFCMFFCLLKPYIENYQLTIIERGKYTRCKNRWYLMKDIRQKKSRPWSLFKKKKYCIKVCGIEKSVIFIILKDEGVSAILKNDKNHKKT